MAVNASRAYLINRRGTGVGDLANCNDKSGQIDAWGDSFMRALAANNVHQIGIGTETEVGLEVDRYPIRAIMVGGTDETAEATVCVRYWSVLTVEGNTIPFRRAPPVNTNLIQNLYRFFPQLDTSFNACQEGAVEKEFMVREAATADVNALYGLSQMASPTDAQALQISTLASKITGDALGAKEYAYFKIGENAFLVSRKHGSAGGGNGAPAAANYMRDEFNATMVLNYQRFNRTYPTVSSGLKTACAISIAWMFTFGLYECYESKEFVTVVIGPKAANADPAAVGFPVVKLDAPAGYVWGDGVTVGSIVNCTGLRVDKVLLALSPALVYLAGVNHYTFNHTTNGMRVGGPLLSCLMMYKLYSSSNVEAEEEDQTRLVYETLHPVNKRAIANLFFYESQVTTWGRAASAPRMGMIRLDAFLTLRAKPVPAGAHKAYLAGVVLERILRQQWAAFLPWVGDITSVIDVIKQIVSQGARSHVGSSYYTGMPGLVQSGQLDPYLPELAQYIQIMAARDTLALSPHLGHEIAAKSSTQWTNLLKSIKSKEVTNVAPEKVSEFLRSAGNFTLQFNPDDPATWITVAQNSFDQAKVLGDLLRTPSGN